MLEYNHTHMCVVCGVTRPTKHLKLARRIDEVINLDETVWICVEQDVCRRSTDERMSSVLLHYEQLMSAPIRGKGGRPKKPAGLPKVKTIRRSRATLQVFPLHRSKVKRKKGSAVVKLDAKAAAAREGSRERELERQAVYESYERERS